MQNNFNYIIENKNKLPSITTIDDEKKKQVLLVLKISTEPKEDLIKTVKSFNLETFHRVLNEHDEQNETVPNPRDFDWSKV